MSINKSNSKPLVQAFLHLRTESEMKDFLDGIHTPQEIDMLVQRLEIIKQLKRRVAQRQIAQNLGVGIATVTRGAREIKMGRFATI